MKDQKLKHTPPFTSDEAVEQFLENTDLSEYDFSDFKPMHFELDPKPAHLTSDKTRAEVVIAHNGEHS